MLSFMEKNLSDINKARVPYLLRAFKESVW